MYSLFRKIVLKCFAIIGFIIMIGFFPVLFPFYVVIIFLACKTKDAFKRDINNMFLFVYKDLWKVIRR